MSLDSNLPEFAKNYTEEEKKVVSEVIVKSLSKGYTKDEAQISAMSAVKVLRKQNLVKKESEINKRQLPSHVQIFLDKNSTILPKESEKINESKPRIKQEFLPKNSLTTDKDRNLVSVVLTEDFKLTHTFDTGEQLVTDLSKIFGKIENHVTVANNIPGDNPVFIQDLQPNHSGKYIWIQTNINDDPNSFTIFFNDGT